MMSGNAGGAKDPDFWRAFEDGEVKVIGDEPATPTTIRVHQRLLCRLAKTDQRPKALSRDASTDGPSVVCLTLKPVGKPGAGNRHARSDERGWERGDGHRPKATAPSST